MDAAVQLLRPHLIGERADEPARVSEKLRQSTFWQGRGGAVEHAISGIDIALWDLFGKLTNQPVARLLGGVYRDRIKPYGSLLFDERYIYLFALNHFCNISIGLNAKLCCSSSGFFGITALNRYQFCFFNIL